MRRGMAPWLAPSFSSPSSPAPPALSSSWLSESGILGEQSSRARAACRVQTTLLQWRSKIAHLPNNISTLLFFYSQVLEVRWDCERWSCRHGVRLLWLWWLRSLHRVSCWRDRRTVLHRSFAGSQQVHEFIAKTTPISSFQSKDLSHHDRLKVDDPVNAVAVHGGGGKSCILYIFNMIYRSMSHSVLWRLLPWYGIILSMETRPGSRPVDSVPLFFSHPGIFPNISVQCSVTRLGVKFAKLDQWSVITQSSTRNLTCSRRQRLFYSHHSFKSTPILHFFRNLGTDCRTDFPFRWFTWRKRQRRLANAFVELDRHGLHHCLECRHINSALWNSSQGRHLAC